MTTSSDPLRDLPRQVSPAQRFGFTPPEPALAPEPPEPPPPSPPLIPAGPRSTPPPADFVRAVAQGARRYRRTNYL
jgi:hypothetical protein